MDPTIDNVLERWRLAKEQPGFTPDRFDAVIGCMHQVGLYSDELIDEYGNLLGEVADDLGDDICDELYWDFVEVTLDNMAEGVFAPGDDLNRRLRQLRGHNPYSSFGDLAAVVVEHCEAELPEEWLRTAGLYYCARHDSWSLEHELLDPKRITRDVGLELLWATEWRFEHDLDGLGKLFRYVLDDDVATLDEDALFEDVNAFVRETFVEAPNAEEGLLAFGYVYGTFLSNSYYTQMDADTINACAAKIRRYDIDGNAAEALYEMLASQDQCPLDLLCEIANDPTHDRAHVAITQREQLPVDVMEALATHSTPRPLVRLASREDLTPSVFDALADNEDLRVRTKLAQHPFIPNELLDRLAVDEEPLVRHFVALHPSVSNELLDRLTTDEDVLTAHTARCLRVERRTLYADDLTF